MDDDEAVKAAVDSCIKDGVLKSILQEDRNRVISSILTALTQEEIDALHESEVTYSHHLSYRFEVGASRSTGLTA